MKRCAAVLALSLVAVQGHAEETGRAADTVFLGATGGPAQVETCVEVEIGDERASGLNCLNQFLQREVARVQPPRNIAPVDAASQSVQVGGFNQTALRQQYGRNFGNSVMPFRPPPPVYSNSLRPGP